MIGNRRKRIPKSDAELDITSFMNLMIVLVPVLLMMMVFSRITVVELNLPGLANLSEDEPVEAQVLEVRESETGLEVFFPQGYLVTKIPKIIDTSTSTTGQTLNPAPNEQNAFVHDYASLQTTLKQIKQSLLSQGVDKKDISLLMRSDTDYQTIVSLIDATRSYKDVLIASEVDAELFPEVSLGDAPVYRSSNEREVAQ